MTQDQANTWIVTSLAVSGALVVVRDAGDGKVPPVRLAVGLTVAGVLLGTMAQASPQLAGGFAIVLLLSSSLVYGEKAWTTLGDLFPGGAVKGRGSKARPRWGPKHTRPQ